MGKGTADPKPAVEVRATHTGRFRTGYAWELTVRPDGKAELTLHQPDKDVRRTFDLAVGPRRKLERAIADHRFFDLPEQVGKEVPDGSKRTLRVKRGKQERTVTIYFISPEDLTAAEKENARRAVRVWEQVRGLFDDADAFDSRPYDKKLFPPEGDKGDTPAEP